MSDEVKPYNEWTKAELKAEIQNRNESLADPDKIRPDGTANQQLIDALEFDDAATEEREKAAKEAAEGGSMQPNPDDDRPRDEDGNLIDEDGNVIIEDENPDDEGSEDNEDEPESETVQEIHERLRAEKSAAVARPKGRIIGQYDPITFEGSDKGSVIIVTEDVYREVYPRGSMRPTFKLVYPRGTQVPQSVIQKVNQETRKLKANLEKKPGHEQAAEYDKVKHKA